MCRAVACKTCGKTTWAGCGQHVDSVMASVPRADRCSCDRAAAQSSGRSNQSSGLFASWFGRRG